MNHLSTLYFIFHIKFDDKVTRAVFRFHRQRVKIIILDNSARPDPEKEDMFSRKFNKGTPTTMPKHFGEM